MLALNPAALPYVHRYPHTAPGIPENRRNRPKKNPIACTVESFAVIMVEFDPSGLQVLFHSTENVHVKGTFFIDCISPHKIQKIDIIVTLIT